MNRLETYSKAVIPNSPIAIADLQKNARRTAESLAEHRGIEEIAVIEELL